MCAESLAGPAAKINARDRCRVVRCDGVTVKLLAAGLDPRIVTACRGRVGSSVVEQRPFKPLVVGSNPTRPTTSKPQENPHKQRVFCMFGLPSSNARQFPAMPPKRAESCNKLQPPEGTNGLRLPTPTSRLPGCRSARGAGRGHLAVLGVAAGLGGDVHGAHPGRRDPRGVSLTRGVTTTRFLGAAGGGGGQRGGARDPRGDLRATVPVLVGPLEVAPLTASPDLPDFPAICRSRWFSRCRSLPA